MVVRSRLWMLGVATLALALACGASQSASSGPGTDAAQGGQGPQGGDSGADAPVDATDGAADAMGDAADANAEAQVSHCAGPPDGGALSAPEAIVTGESSLDGLAISSEGPVWLENYEEPAVWLASDPPKLLFDSSSAPLSPMSVGNVVDFAAAGDWYVLSVYGYVRPAELVAVNILSGKTVSLEQESPRVAMDELRVYAAVPFVDDISCFPIVPGSCGPTVHTDALALATGRSKLYAVIAGPNFFTDGSHTIRAKTKGSAEPLVTVASGDLKEGGGFEVAAAAGSVAWVYLQPPSGPPRTIYGVVDGGAPRILVNDPDGVGDPDALWTLAPGFARVIALDDQYVYWTTQTGKVKRRRLCGGPVEVLATNQQYPMALTVDDSAIYWISRGPDVPYPIGNIMRIRKLDAPDAGADAASDASSGWHHGARSGSRATHVPTRADLCPKVDPVSNSEEDAAE